MRRLVDAISAAHTEWAIILCELNVLRVCGAMAAGRLLLVLYAVFYLLDRELGVKQNNTQTVAEIDT